jgi:hypothetical protein
MDQNENQNPDPTEIELEEPKQNPLLTHGFLTFIIVALILVIVGGTYYWWQEIKKENSAKQLQQSCIEGTIDCIDTIDTGTWKTFSHEEYGFEFKYPNDLKILNNNDERYQRIVLEFSSGSLMSYVESSSFYSVYSNLDEKSGDIKSFRHLDGKDYEFWQQNIGAYKSYSLIIEPHKTINFQNISGSTSDFEIFDQILSTFRFTDSNSRETAPNFEIKYPEGWISSPNTTYSTRYVDGQNKYAIFLSRTEPQGMDLDRVVSGITIYIPPSEINYSSDRRVASRVLFEETMLQLEYKEANEAEALQIFAQVFSSFKPN